MIYIITFFILILVVIILYFRNKNKNKKRESIINLLEKINIFLKKSDEDSKPQKSKVNIINDMGKILPYSTNNYSLINHNYTFSNLKNDDNEYQHLQRVGDDISLNMNKLNGWRC